MKEHGLSVHGEKKGSETGCVAVMFVRSMGMVKALQMVSLRRATPSRLVSLYDLYGVLSD